MPVISPEISPEISIVVCTRDRPVALAHCIAAVRVAAARTAAAIELVVVDSSRTASARTLVGSLAPRPRLALRFCHAPGPGLAGARNAGLEAAGGSLIAFADDDCRITPGYLAALGEAFAGGRAGVLTGGTGHGSGFAVSREAAERIGRFDPRFGPGGPLRWGELADYVLRARRARVPVARAPVCRVERFGDPASRTPLADICFGAGGLFAKHRVASPLRGCRKGHPDGLPRFAAIAATLGGMCRYWTLAAAARAP